MLTLMLMQSENKPEQLTWKHKHGNWASNEKWRQAKAFPTSFFDFNVFISHVRFYNHPSPQKYPQYFLF